MWRYSVDSEAVGSNYSNSDVTESVRSSPDSGEANFVSGNLGRHV